jgi:uncharacterized membrane protein
MMDARRKFIGVLVFFGLVFLVSAIQAQTTAKKSTTTIRGIVLDANGKPVASAAVTCQSSAGMRPRIVRTDASGHFSVPGLKQDSYDLRATTEGAYSDWERNVPLRKGQTKEITLRLLNGNTALSNMPADTPKN